jgi:uncharacterized membrane-anchored protein YitT (DUF2179 family)
MGIVMGIVILFLLKNTGLYNSGLSAIGQGISRFIYTNLQLHGNTTNAEMIFNILFWGLYFVLNVPFFIFGYLKIGKTFGLLTIVFLFFNTLTGFCLSLIPHINQILILGDTIPIGYTGNDHQNFAFAGQNVFAHYGVYILPFDFNANPGVIAGQNFLSQQIFDSDADSVRALFLLIYGIAYGLVSAVCYAMIYVVGACTAGLDFVSVYYATVKQKSLGSFLIIFNSLSMVVGASLGSYASAGLIQSQA